MLINEFLLFITNYTLLLLAIITTSFSTHILYFILFIRNAVFMILLLTIIIAVGNTLKEGYIKEGWGG